MAVTKTGTTTVNYLRSILLKFPQECNYSFAYGSGIFLQKGQKAGKMIDLIFVVDDPVKWHDENLRMNYSHYSGLRRFGPNFIANIQEKMASGIYYNPFVKVENSLIKYGVISTEALEADLSQWRHLYVAGRLHKPVLDIIPPQSEKLVQLIEKNREMAVRAALLLNSRSLRKTDLYYTIAELSYIGDFRMAVGEHPDKVKNIVTPLVPHFDHIYYPLLVKMKSFVNMDKHGLITQEIDANGRLQNLMGLPYPLQRSLARRIRHDPRVSDVEDALLELSHYPNLSPYVRKSIAEVVRGSSILQTVQGILSAGVVRSVKYGFEKIMKKVTAKRDSEKKPGEEEQQQHQHLLPPPAEPIENPVVEYELSKPKESFEPESFAKGVRNKVMSLAVGKPWLSDNGLRVEKRSCRSISLSWEPESPSESSIFRRSSILLSRDPSKDHSEQGQDVNKPWYEVQMKLGNTESWSTVYKGFNLKCEVKDLNPDAHINFRLKKEGDEEWGSTIIAATDAAPPTAEDLHRAIHCNAEDMVLRIIGASRNAHIKKLLTSHDRAGLTSLMIAAQNGNNNILNILIQSGTPVNGKSPSSQKTALMLAAFHGHLSTVQLLDRAGADWSAQDKTGCNALHHAVNGGHLRVVLYILDRTGKEFINSRDETGWTPLMRAVVVGSSTDIVKLLLLRGADPNATDKINTKSCLMAATLLGKHEMVHQLLQGKADPMYVNANDKSVLDVSHMVGSEEVRNRIRDAITKSKTALGMVDEEESKSRPEVKDHQNGNNKKRKSVSALEKPNPP